MTNNYPISYQTPVQSYQQAYKPMSSQYYVAQQPVGAYGNQTPSWPNQAYPVQQNNVEQAGNQPLSNIIWVQGESGAKAYILPNGNTMALWDSEQQTIYVKSVDANGRPTMTILDYVDRNAPTVTEEPITQNYVTQDQLESFSNQVTQQMADLQKKLNDFKSKIGNINSKKEAK